MTEPAAEPTKEKKASKTKKPPRRVGGPGFLMVLMVIVVLLMTLMGIAAPGPLVTERTILIPYGTNVRAIAAILDTDGAVYNPILFRIAAKLGARNSLKAGEYKLLPQMSIAEIVDAMHEGLSITHTFTVAEGLTSQEVVNLLKASPILTGDVTVPSEGTLLPETYRYTFGDTREGMIQRMQRGMLEMVSELWEKRDAGVTLQNPAEALVLASIVEKETAKPSERPRIAQVFYNRLRKGMRLQSDPTVIYAITKDHGLMDHDIGHADLAYPSPYNTYMSDGLPPGPICNPGRASLEAVLHPEPNDFLYFVADGTGGHAFSQNMDEHNKNVGELIKTKVKEKAKKKKTKAKTS